MPALGLMTEALDKAESLYADLMAAVREALKSEVPALGDEVATAWRRSVELPVLQGGSF
jgi:hypothetical protein